MSMALPFGLFRIFDRSDRFLRAFDALCAAVFALLAWRTQSWVWAASSALSTGLCVTGATFHLQNRLARLMRSGALSITLRKGL